MATKKKSSAPKVNAPDPAAAETAPVAKGAWTKQQTPPEQPKTSGHVLVSLEKPRRIVAEVPDEVVSYEQDNDGNKVLVFDGVRCPKGVVNFHGTPCFVDGAPENADELEAEEEAA